MGILSVIVNVLLRIRTLTNNKLSYLLYRPPGSPLQLPSTALAESLSGLQNARLLLFAVTGIRKVRWSPKFLLFRDDPSRRDNGKRVLSFYYACALDEAVVPREENAYWLTSDEFAGEPFYMDHRELLQL